ncbi:hypothetical protein [Aeriscardovia aeriphila]|uniref:Uncharacterized protein n=1 Tax=Aeriscardovia aeriphila TaxID=218139 RepID=A0A261F813_9BIFI|nr:hypothetical protein [Aeriscardovia aeriphila]NYI25181.1 hypothetical protein [Aeriscardovia aeriphila]OZG55272.1 hypothetical protein AEAE_1069 [Aeriscardovia aeriphila]
MRQLFHEIRNGITLVTRHFVQIITIMLLMGLVCFSIGMNLSTVTDKAIALKQSQELRAHDPVYFSAYYDNSVPKTQDQSAIHILSTELAKGSAVSYVNTNIELSNKDFANRHHVLIVMGKKTNLAVFGIPNPQSTKPRAYLGADLPEKSIDLPIAGYHLTASQHLPSHASFFSPHGFGESLAHHVVIVLPPSALSRMDEQEKTRALFNTIFLMKEPSHISDDDLSLFLHSCYSWGMSLVPQNLSVSLPEQFRKVVALTISYVVPSLALLILVFFLFFSLGKTLVREELTELRIRYFFGATLGSLSIRVITFLLLSLVVPAVLPSALLAYQAQQQFAIPGIIILTFTLVVFLVCTLTTMRTIKRSIS